AHGYFLTRTSKAVRDRCIEEGATIARASVNFILRGITFGGHRFGQNGNDEPLTLARCFYRNVLGLCESAGLQLDEEERARISDWLLGEVQKSPVELAEGEPEAAADEEGGEDPEAAAVTAESQAEHD